MASYNKFNCFVEDVHEKKHNLASDTLKVMLTNSAPSASNTVKANITEISAGNGYTAGGATLTVTSSSQTSGTYKLVIDDKTITASGGSIGPFRYAVIYNDTASNDELIAWYDYGASTTLLVNESVLIDFNGTDGLFFIDIATMYDAIMLSGIGITIGIVLLFDLWLYLRWGYEATISAVITRTGRKHTWFSLLLFLVFGFLLWHWFG